jgi:hypothetical protein
MEGRPVHDATIEITYKPAGKPGTVMLTVKRGPDVVAVEKLEVADHVAREKLATRLSSDCAGIDCAELSEQLIRIAAEVAEDADSDGRRESQADKLVALAKDMELFSTPGSIDADAYATFEVGTLPHLETWAIRSRGFGRHLQGVLHAAHGKVSNPESLKAALDALEAKALFEGGEREVAVRVTRHENAIYLDLCNQDWQVVEVTAEGWRVLDSRDAPVRFIRKRGMLPLPKPVPGGSIEELRPLVNVPDDAQWTLLVGWVIMALNPSGPYPVLIVDGEQGSAKTSLCWMIRGLIDPNVAPLRRPPKQDHDLAIAAKNSWLIGFDNLSGLSPALSDAVCCLATGSGFATRELYADDDEKLFQASRPVMMNGIDDLASRADLMDRAVCLHLPLIREEGRMEEADLRKRFHKILPRLIGALLDAASTALGRFESVKMNRKPRMADFARWATAAEAALGWAPGTFMSAYWTNRKEANDRTIESSSLALAIIDFMMPRTEWTGTTLDLLTELDKLGAGDNDVQGDEGDDPNRFRRWDWPKTPAKLASMLRRLAPALRSQGVMVTWNKRRSNRGRFIIIRKVAAGPSQPSQPMTPSHSIPLEPITCDSDGCRDDVPSDMGQPSQTVTNHHQDNQLQINDLQAGGDGSDACDGDSPTQSPGDDDAEEEMEWTA